MSLRPFGRPGPRLTCSGAGAMAGRPAWEVARMGVGGGFEGDGAGGDGDVRLPVVGPAIVVYGKDPVL